LLHGNIEGIDLQQDLNALGIAFQIIMEFENPASVSKLQNVIRRHTNLDQTWTFFKMRTQNDLISHQCILEKTMSLV
jgi:hypothetical protein